MTSATTACTVTYSQPGDANYSSAPTVTETTAATKAAQTISFAQPPSPQTFGATFSVSATSNSGLSVTIAGSGGCWILNGTVTMTSGTTVCTLTASQAGDANYSAATNVVRIVNATKTAQTITVTTHAPASAAFNTSFTVAATASSGLPVTYSSSGGCTNTGATFTMTSGTTACSVIFDQGGDADHAAAPQVIELVSASKTGQSTTFAQPPSPQAFGATFPVSATASSGLTVTVRATGGCSILNGIVTMTSGTTDCTLRASQPGDADYSAALDIVRSVGATKTAQTIAVTTPAPASAAFNTSFTVAATASSGLPVTYSSSGGCTNTGATFTMTSGTTACGVTYDQAGDADHAAAPQVIDSINGTQTTGATQTITVSTPAPASAAYGSSFTVAATASSGLAVTYDSSGGCTNTGATFTMTSGTTACTVTYSQAGDASYSAAVAVVSSVIATVPISAPPGGGPVPPTVVPSTPAPTVAPTPLPIGDVTLPTATPTASTVAPTVPPTQAPTPPSTAVPTIAPSVVSTAPAPTAAPTVAGVLATPVSSLPPVNTGAPPPASTAPPTVAGVAAAPVATPPSTNTVDVSLLLALLMGVALLLVIALFVLRGPVRRY